MRLRRTGTGDLVVPALFFGVAPEALVQIGPDAPADARIPVAPGERHLVARQKSAPIRLRVQVERPVTAGTRPRPRKDLAAVRVEQKRDVPTGQMVMAAGAEARRRNDFGHSVALDEG